MHSSQLSVASNDETPGRDTALRETLRPLARFLSDPQVTEICINRPGEAFTESAFGWQKHELPETTILWCRRIAQLIATFSAQKITERDPSLSASLPDGEREKFLDWLFGFEYGLLGLPEPSLVFYLDVPTEVTERLMRERERATHTAADIHEADDAYLRECRENARGVAARCGWQRVDCTRDGRMRGIEDIHEEVYARVKALLG